MAARSPRALLALGLALAAAAGATDPFSPQLGDTSGCRGQCGRSLQRRADAVSHRARGYREHRGGHRERGGYREHGGHREHHQHREHREQRRHQGVPGASRGWQHSTLSSSSSPQDAVLNACYRGCRLFSICHFVDASAELNTTRAECEAACTEAYSSAEEQFGCVTGCRKQLPEVENRKEKSLELKVPSFSMFDLVSTFCNDIVSSAQSFISSTWTFYLQADDGKVVVFQVGGSLCSLSDGCERGGDPVAHGFLPLGEKPPVKEPRGKAKGQHPEPPAPEHDFLGCMSKRSGLPRWILAACLFLSIMVMLWLSCASLVTAPEQHVKTQVYGVRGAHSMGVPNTPGLPIMDAGPLPLKVDLDKTIL
uniref:Uncharacterized protein n=1 Tax=Melopsittacus undulatus TaxID=13146 RepID=A0A8C6JAR8_MELUD